jgi:hypothetical protein
MECLIDSLTAREIRQALEGLDDDALVYVGVHRGIRARRIATEGGEIGTNGLMGIPLHNWYPIRCLAFETVDCRLAPIVCGMRDLGNNKLHKGGPRPAPL